MKFKLNWKGVRKLLQSNEMAKVIDDKAAMIASKVNNSTRNKQIGRFRVNARIYSQKKNNDLLKALQASKGK